MLDEVGGKSLLADCIEHYAAADTLAPDPGVTLVLRPNDVRRQRQFPIPRASDMIFEKQRAKRFAPSLLSSSMAEHPAVNRRVVGSSPT